MGEARRRKLLGVENSHNGTHWRRTERKLAREAREEFQRHDSKAEGTFRGGEVLAEDPKPSKPSKLLDRLAKHRLVKLLKARRRMMSRGR